MNLHAALMTVLLTAAAAGGTAVGGALAQSWPPADDASAKIRLAESSRHGEYVDILVPGRATPLRAFVVYPETATKASVVIVLHETYGLTDWIRGITDQLAADGFIAIAPDLLAGKAPKGGDTTKFASRDDAIKAARSLTSDEIVAALIAVRAYGVKLPASTGKAVTLAFPGTPRFDGDDRSNPGGVLRQSIGQDTGNQPAAQPAWLTTLTRLSQQVQ
jgi:carboxymethylenebutenolidase